MNAAKLEFLTSILYKRKWHNVESIISTNEINSIQQKTVGLHKAEYSDIDTLYCLLQPMLLYMFIVNSDIIFEGEFPP